MFRLRSFTAGLLIAALSGAGVAVATTKKTDKVNLTDVKEVKRAKGAPVEKGQTRITRNEAFIIATETRLLSEINKAIAYLSKTAERMPKKSTARLEMREKLINLRLEAAIYHTNQEMRRYDRDWAAWDNGGRKGTEPRLDDSRSKGMWATLARDGQTLLTEFPRSKNADVTMFNMGLANFFLKREKDAARIFSQLISKYPNSQKAGDAYFALGDFYFDKSDFRNAMNNYKNALRFPGGKFYAWSLFKLGWCSYNLGQYPQALSYWKQTVSGAAKGGKKGMALKDEALRDMVYAFAELRQVEPAISYYRRNGGQKYIGRFLLLLSQTFSDQGQYNEAIKVLKRFQQVEPYDEGGPDTQKEIIGLNYELSRMPVVWAELARFPKLFGPGSRWAERNQGNRKLFLETQQLIKDQILYYAKLTHKTAQKDDNQRLYAEAMRGYGLFLGSYPKSREVPEVKYNMADIQYFAKNYREAGKLYRDIALLGKDKAIIIDPKSGKASNIHKQSADYMLDAYATQYDPELKVLLKRKPDFKKPPIPISENGKNFITACGYYQKWYPQDKKNVKTCDIAIAEIFYRSNDRKLALKNLWLVAKKYPGTKEGDEAVENLIPLYQNDKAGLAKAAAELQKIPAYGKGAIGRKLKDLQVGTEIELAQAEKNRCARAKKYEDLYKKNPNNKDAGALINNAGTDYVACGKVSEGIMAYMIVLKRFPTLPVAKDALLEVAKLQKNRLEFATSAGFFSEFARKYPKEKEATGALAEACEMLAAVGSDGAVGACLNFAARDQEVAKFVFIRMLRAAYSARDEGRLSSLVRTFDSKFKLSADERITAYAMLYNVNNGNGGMAQQAAQQITQTFQRSGGNVGGEALRAVGGLVFRRVNGEIARFAQMRLKGGTVDALAASIQQKVAGLGKVQQAYDQVIATKDSYWGVAALYQLGYARELIARDLEDPPEIKGATRDDVVKQLAGDAKAARQEAAKFYGQALDAVEKFMVYNEWAAKALSGAARNAGKNVSFDDMIVQPDFLGGEVPESIASAVKAGG
jgi:TolA-binding protein